MLRRLILVPVLVLAVALVVPGAPAGAAPASAAPASAAPLLPSADPFYTWSGPLGAVPRGTVLRTRSVTLAVNGSTTPVQATQLLYRTVGGLGQPTVTVTTVIRPTQTLNEPAAAVRIVSWQTFYDALGSECDPSYTFRGGNPSYSEGSEEEALIAPYLASGDTIVVSDYEGEDLEWGAGQESGEDTLDGIRAAENFLSVPEATTPVAMVGYSGGSIATQWAGELAPSYAPRLDLVGAADGGVPVDFAHNLAYINGSPDWSGVIPAVLVGVARAYHVDLSQYLSAYGKKITQQVAGGCINSFTGAYPGLKIQSLLEPQYQNFDSIPVFASIIDQLIMGSDGTPREPQLLGVGNVDGTGDGVMVAADVEALAHEYCQRGVDVQFYQYNGDSHTQAAIPFEAEAEAFVRERLAGLPVASNCSSVGAGNSLAPLAISSAPSGAPAAAPPSSSPPGATAGGAPSAAGGGAPAARSGTLPLTGIDSALYLFFALGLLMDGLLLVGVARQIRPAWAGRAAGRAVSGSRFPRPPLSGRRLGS